MRRKAFVKMFLVWLAWAAVMRLGYVPWKTVLGLTPWVWSLMLWLWYGIEM